MISNEELIADLFCHNPDEFCMLYKIAHTLVHESDQDLTIANIVAEMVNSIHNGE